MAMRPNSSLLAFADRRFLRFAILWGTLAGFCSIGIAYSLSKGLGGIFLEHFSLRTLLAYLAIILSLALLRSMFSTAQTWFAGKLAAQAKSRLRAMLIDRFQKDSRAVVMTRFMRGIESLDPWYSQYLPQLFLSMIVPATILVISLVVDPLSALVFLVTAPLLPLFLALIGMTAKKKSDEHWMLLAQQGNLYLETLVGLKTLRQFGRSREWGNTLRISAETLRNATMGILRLAFLSAFVLEMVGTIGTAIIAVEIGIRLLHGMMHYQQALFVLLLAPEFYLPLRQLGLRAHASMEGEAIAKDFFPQSVYNSANYTQTPIITHKLAKFANPTPTDELPAKLLSTPTIFVSNLTVAWPGQNNPAIKHLSFSLSSGSFIAVAGASGCGKSTLFAALLGLVIPTQGNVVCNVRSQVWIPQQPKLMHRTLRANLWQIPRPDLSLDSILWSALAQVGLDEFVRNLPQGLDTLAGEGGTRFSGGQARRLCLARAFLQPHALVLMDEPEAHLDNTSIECLEAALAKLKFSTRLVISHRPATLAQADRVLFLEQGLLKGFAPHQELWRDHEAYRTLLQGSTHP